MKTLLLLSAVIFATAVAPAHAQNTLPSQAAANHTAFTDSVPAKKWFFSKYAGISGSVAFFNGGNAFVYAVPVGIQLNRKLSNNWCAFAGLSAAPAYTCFNHSFLTTNTSKFLQGNSVYNNSRFGINTRAEMGLMYTNDQRTFSISGSIGIEKNSYPWLLPGATLQPVPMRW